MPTEYKVWSFELVWPWWYRPLKNVTLWLLSTLYFWHVLSPERFDCVWQRYLTWLITLTGNTACVPREWKHANPK